MAALLLFVFLIFPRETFAAVSAKPTKTQIVDISSSAFTVNWKEKNKGAVTYSVYITTSADFNFWILSASVIDLESGVDKIATAIIAGLSPQTKYWACVKAQAQGKETSPCSSPDSAVTLAPPKIRRPEKPTRTQVVEVGADWAVVSWKEKNTGSIRYVVSASTDPANLLGSIAASFGLSDPDSQENKITTATLAGLKPNRRYFFSARAFIEGEASLFSSPDRAVTLARPPRSLSVERVARGEYFLRWDGAGNPEDTAYEVAYSRDSFVSEITIAAVFADRLTANRFIIRGLSPNQAYKFRVRAKNSEDAPTSFALSEAPLSSIPEASLGDVYAYPVPWRPNDDDPTNGTAAGITFANLPSQGTLRIFGVDGALARAIELSGGASILWDGKNEEGYFAASGVYIWLLKSPALTKKGKLVIIR